MIEVFEVLISFELRHFNLISRFYCFSYNSMCLSTLYFVCVRIKKFLFLYPLFCTLLKLTTERQNVYDVNVKCDKPFLVSLSRYIMHASAFVQMKISLPAKGEIFVESSKGSLKFMCEKKSKANFLSQTFVDFKRKNK